MFNYILKFIVISILMVGVIVYLNGSNNYIQISPNPTDIEGYKPILYFMVILSALNFFIKPILKIISLPITCLTLGLFSLIINLIITLLADYLVDSFKFKSILIALVFSLLFSFTNTVLDSWLKDSKS